MNRPGLSATLLPPYQEATNRKKHRPQQGLIPIKTTMSRFYTQEHVYEEWFASIVTAAIDSSPQWLVSAQFIGAG